jgi:hypothetical protein
VSRGHRVARVLGAGTVLGAAALTAATLLRRRRPSLSGRSASSGRSAPSGRPSLADHSAQADHSAAPGRGAGLRLSRGLATVRLAARGGARYAGNAPRLFASAGEHREKLRNDLALRTAEDVAATLGTMKGVLMKLGQMASYVDDGLSPAARRTLSRLQDSVPPMSRELAAQVITEELGEDPDRLFAEWDPVPIAAASIGQVHRAMTRDGRAVAVKVQYPGIAETIEADLGNVALLRKMLRIMAPQQDVAALIAELRERITEELDYRREARNQQLFADYYAGHPTISVPRIVPEYSARRVVTSELADGVRFAELVTWSQAERDQAAETIYRFVFRSLYEMHAFNGDPHPGNYLFGGGGRVTFLDFGLVKHFTDTELRPLVEMVKHLCVENDPEQFRRSMEDAGFLLPDAPLPTDQIVDHMAVFYDTVREPGPRAFTSGYASAVARRFFDFRSPLAAYVQIPRSYVILQRINLGLFALLGELQATADWRRIAEEIWPFTQAPPSTPLGEAEAPWLTTRPTLTPSPPHHPPPPHHPLGLHVSWCGDAVARAAICPHLRRRGHTKTPVALAGCDAEHREAGGVWGGEAADCLAVGYAGYHRQVTLGPRGDVRRVLAAQVAQDPADCLADEELLLPQHRCRVAIEALPVRLPGPDPREQCEQRGPAHPEVGVLRPFIDIPPSGGVAEDDPPGDVARQRINQRPGGRGADQRLDRREVRRLQHRDTQPENLDRCHPALVHWLPPQRQRPLDRLVPAQPRVLAHRSGDDAAHVRHADAPELQVAFQVALLLGGSFLGTERSQGRDDSAHGDLRFSGHQARVREWRKGGTESPPTAS